MHSLDRQPSPFRLTPRCCAQTRAGTPCMSPAVRGKRRCRMHGGAKGTGAPKGERNGAYRTGMFTAEMVELRREVNLMVRMTNAAIRTGLD
ncbi:MAG: hypothetical protein CMH16_02180 [Methylobacterium sp.]|nr:hypothetical protein [Methylobacterium sp.]